MGVSCIRRTLRLMHGPDDCELRAQGQEIEEIKQHQPGVRTDTEEDEEAFAGTASIC